MTRMLKRSLADALTPSEAEAFVSSFDQIGEIIIVRIPDELMPKRHLIGQALLEEIRMARSVFCQISAVDGEYRTRGLELVAGCDDPTTTYRESGCRFVIDVKNAFFSPRLSHERERIAGLVRDGETVLNMFGGVGMFSIIAAMNTPCTVYNVDSNPAAHGLCQKNVALNEYSRKKRKRKMAGRVISVCGEASEVVRDVFDGTSDRTLMLLPERSDDFIKSAVRATADGGIIHYYSHVHADCKKDAPRLSEMHYLDVTPARSEILDSRIVRPVGPRYYQTVVDAVIHK